MGLWAAAKAKHERDLARAATEPKVVVYDNARDFQRDAKKMLGKGWTVAGQSQDGKGRITATRLVALGPFALLARKGGGKVTVTWMPPT